MRAPRNVGSETGNEIIIITTTTTTVGSSQRWAERGRCKERRLLKELGRGWSLQTRMDGENFLKKWKFQWWDWQMALRKTCLFSYNYLHFLLYSSSYRPLSLLSPPHSPLTIVTLFLISMSLVIFCLLFSFLKKKTCLIFSFKRWTSSTVPSLFVSHFRAACLVIVYKVKEMWGDTHGGADHFALKETVEWCGKIIFKLNFLRENTNSELADASRNMSPVSTPARRSPVVAERNKFSHFTPLHGKGLSFSLEPP